MDMVGIYGGTFDPVHHGHLRTAFEVFETLNLSELRFMPCGDVPAHRNSPVATAQQRLAMLALAIQESLSIYPFYTDACEVQRSGPSYMIDSLQSLREELGADRPLCLILGQDAFLGLTAWHRWERLLAYAHIVVMTRPNVVLNMSDALAAGIEPALSESPAVLRDYAAGRVHFMPVIQLDISASRIRELIGARRSACFLTPKPVLDFIEREQIYQCSSITYPESPAP
jgi:nicotinate-nucleotide adenylyltransferase